MLVLEIVFVGQCEVFVCLDFGHPSPHRSTNGMSVLEKNVDFSNTYSLKLVYVV